MSITYQLTRKEIGRANRQHLRTHPRTYFFQFFVLFYVVIQPIFINGYGRFIDWGVMLIWFIAIVRSARKTDAKTSKKTVTILESGIQIESKYENKIMYWNLINDVTFTKEFILIYIDRKVEVIVPLRAFKSKEEVDKFEEKIPIHLKF